MTKQLDNLLDIIYKHLNVIEVNINLYYYSDGKASVFIGVKIDGNAEKLDKKVINIFKREIEKFNSPFAISIYNFNSYLTPTIRKVCNGRDIDNIYKHSFCIHVKIQYDKDKKLIKKDAQEEYRPQLNTKEERIEMRKIFDHIEDNFGIVTHFEINPSVPITKLYYSSNILFKNRELNDLILKLTDGSYIKEIRYYVSIGNDLNYFVIDIDGYNFKENDEKIFNIETLAIPIKITIRDRNKSEYEEIDRYFNKNTLNSFTLKESFDDYFSNYYDRMNPLYYNKIFLIRLDVDLINRYLIKNNFIYFIDKKGNIVLSVEKKMITDINKFLDGINILINKADFKQSMFNTNLNK